MNDLKSLNAMHDLASQPRRPIVRLREMAFHCAMLSWQVDEAAWEASWRNPLTTQRQVSGCSASVKADGEKHRMSTYSEVA